MKLLIALCFTAALFAADNPQATTDDRTDDRTKVQTEAAEKPLTQIPASAAEFEPGSYHYTDAKGKLWILRPTPFGIARMEDTGAPLRKNPRAGPQHGWSEGRREVETVSSSNVLAHSAYTSGKRRRPISTRAKRPLGNAKRLSQLLSRTE